MTNTVNMAIDYSLCLKYHPQMESLNLNPRNSWPYRKEYYKGNHELGNVDSERYLSRQCWCLAVCHHPCYTFKFICYH